MSFHIEAVPSSISNAARSTARSPQYGHPVHVEPAKGYGPCRSCLRQFRVNEEQRLLFTYNPFDGIDSYPSPGPVFIHADECERYEGDAFPPEIRTLPLVLEAYGAGRNCLALRRPADDEIENTIEDLFATSDVQYIHVRNAEAGCFIAHVAR